MAAAVLGIIAAAAGTASSVAGQIKAGSAADQLGQYNADTILQSALSDAQSAEYQAANTLEAAQIAERQQRYQDQISISRARANLGASGITMSGSPLDLIAESTRQSEIQALEIRRGGQIQVESIRRQAQANLETSVRQAEAARLGGSAAATSAEYGAAGSLLSGGYTIGKDIIDLSNTSSKSSTP